MAAFSFFCNPKTDEFIREGHFSRHLRRMRPVYSERRRILVEALERELGNACTIVGDQVGMHVTIYVLYAVPRRDSYRNVWSAARLQGEID